MMIIFLVRNLITKAIQGPVTLNILTSSITTLSILGYFVTHHRTRIYGYAASIECAYSDCCYAEYLYADYHYAEGCYPECRYSEGRYSECHYAERHSAECQYSAMSY
jgi:hypothetical protein